MKKELKEIEDQILSQLANATGNILDNTELIEVLAEANVTSTKIKKEVAEADAKIDVHRLQNHQRQ